MPTVDEALDELHRLRLQASRFPAGFDDGGREQETLDAFVASFGVALAAVAERDGSVWGGSELGPGVGILDLPTFPYDEAALAEAAAAVPGALGSVIDDGARSVLLRTDLPGAFGHDAWIELCRRYDGNVLLVVPNGRIERTAKDAAKAARTSVMTWSYPDLDPSRGPDPRWCPRVVFFAERYASQDRTAALFMAHFRSIDPDLVVVDQNVLRPTRLVRDPDAVVTFGADGRVRVDARPGVGAPRP